MPIGGLQRHFSQLKPVTNEVQAFVQFFRLAYGN